MASGLMNLVCMMMIAAAVVGPLAEATIGCDTVARNMAPCLPYVTGKGPIGRCCGGVKSLLATAKTTPDRQAACNCLKNLAKSYPGVNLGNAAALPTQCRVSIPYKISPTTDCSKVR